MTKFLGRSHIRIDSKGRISLPTSYRNEQNTNLKFRLTNNIYRGHRFLDLLSEREWNLLEKKVSTWPSLKPEVQAFQRFYISSMEQIELDNQGRFLVPNHLRKYAELEDEIVLVGTGNKIEIWNEKNWQGLFGQIEKDFDRVNEVIAHLEESMCSSQTIGKRKEGEK